VASTDARPASEREARYAELEAAEDEKRRARLRRQPLILVGLMAVLTLGVGIVASVDLRRLQTPQGVALRWTQAATFGDCDDYLHYSTGVLEQPSAEVCHGLRAGTAEARQHNVEIGLAVQSVTVSGARAVVVLEITRKDEKRVAQLDLKRTGGRWRVVRDKVSCAVLPCP
jgi:hypothetical protein